MRFARGVGDAAEHGGAISSRMGVLIKLVAAGWAGQSVNNHSRHESHDHAPQQNVRTYECTCALCAQSQHVPGICVWWARPGLWVAPSARPRDATGVVYIPQGRATACAFTVDANSNRRCRTSPGVGRGGKRKYPMTAVARVRCPHALCPCKRDCGSAPCCAIPSHSESTTRMGSAALWRFARTVVR